MVIYGVRMHVDNRQHKRCHEHGYGMPCVHYQSGLNSNRHIDIGKLMTSLMAARNGKLLILLCDMIRTLRYYTAFLLFS